MERVYRKQKAAVRGQSSKRIVSAVSRTTALKSSDFPSLAVIQTQGYEVEGSLPPRENSKMILMM